MPIFQPFDVLIPREEFLDRWPVIACDQFTSQPEYWQRQREIVGDAPSALRCVLPEAELTSADDQTYREIRRTMERYLAEGVFAGYAQSFVYVERTLTDGTVRPGVVGVIDLEAYDYGSDVVSAIRATERTVVERIPPRMRVRRGAALELSHVLLLCDDERRALIEPLRAELASPLYDLQLPQDGGRLIGWLVNGAAARAFEERLADYCRRKEGELNGMLFAVGDGNHSLATAKACYEELKKTSADAGAIARARYAMAELENIHDRSQRFAPIHRLVSGVDASGLIAYLRERCCAEGGYPVPWVSGQCEGVLLLNRELGVLPVGILQSALDDYLAAHPGEIDYIHGEDSLRTLAGRGDAVGFLLPAIPKDDFFRGIARDGVLPRKTFSMGEAREKRYYLEARRL
ncbi:MAG: DUF1015 domain-containing protein [Clostridia bacterium]|nr:DUF1015 domain-containing protein [Clostridia bacterium]